mmetsp:Transcript_3688/g.10614  ORF Transcript_3688/g.10614 Transcript_3688/m.10614 type:complete len:1238 (-) Transcript_3688:60-3773(-)
MIMPVCLQASSLLFPCLLLDPLASALSPSPLSHPFILYLLPSPALPFSPFPHPANQAKPSVTTVNFLTTKYCQTPSAPFSSDSSARPASSLTAGRGRGFTIGRGRGLKAPGCQSSAPTSAFFDKWNPSPAAASGSAAAAEDTSVKANRLVGKHRAGVRQYTISQMTEIYQGLSAASALAMPEAFKDGLLEEDVALLRSPTDPTIPTPQKVVEQHLSVTKETWSYPDATNQPVGAILGMGRGRGAALPRPLPSPPGEAHGLRSREPSGTFPPASDSAGQQDPASQVPGASSALAGNGGGPPQEQPSMLDLSTSAPLPPSPPGNSMLTTSAVAVLVGGDSWQYRDPQGHIQGPFPKHDLLEWFAQGFFPKDLPIRSVLYPAGSPFIPLHAALQVWGTGAVMPPRLPPGFELSPEGLVRELYKLAGAMPNLPPSPALLQHPPEPQPQVQAPMGDLMQRLLGHVRVEPAVGQQMLAAAGPVDLQLLAARLLGAGAAAEQNPAMAGLLLGPQQPIPGLMARELNMHLPPQAPSSHSQQPPAMSSTLFASKGPQLSMESPAMSMEALASMPLEPMPPVSTAWSGGHHAVSPPPQQQQQQAPPVVPFLAGVQKEQQVVVSATRKPSPSRVASLPDDELLFPTTPGPLPSRPTEPEPVVPPPARSSSAPHTAAILPPKKKTGAVAAASAAPGICKPPQPPQQPLPSQDIQPEASPAPPVPRPETKPAPWAAAAATAQKPAGKSLQDIQREEERAMAAASAVAAAAAVEVAAAPPPSFPTATGWAKVAKTNIPAAAPTTGSFKDIQMQEASARAHQQQQHQRAAMAAAAPHPSTSAAPATPPGVTLADMMPSEHRQQQQRHQPAWGGLHSDFEETAADLEGGADEEGIEEVLAAFHRAKGLGPAASASQPAARPPEAAKPLHVIQAEELQRKQLAQQQQQAAANATAAATPAASDEFFWGGDSGTAPSSNGLSEQSALAQRSPAFIEWCREQMQELTGKPDLTLIEFLLSVTTNGEVADYTAMYLGNKNSAAKVSTFTAEFIRRKLADVKAGGATSRKAKKKAAAAAAAASTPSAQPRPSAAQAPVLAPRTAPQQQQPPSAAALVSGRGATGGSASRAAAAPIIQQRALHPAPAAAPPQAAAGGFVGTLGVRTLTAPTASKAAWPNLVSGAPRPPSADLRELALTASAVPDLPPPQQAASAAAAGGASAGGKVKGKKGKVRGQKVDLSLLGFSSGTDYSAFEKPDP